MDTLFVHPRIGRAAADFLGRKHQLFIGGKWVDAKLPLRMTARAIAANTGKKGAIVITLGKDGIHVAADGLNPEEVREALCTAIHASFLFDEG
jgi:hypothetical protein